MVGSLRVTASVRRLHGGCLMVIGWTHGQMANGGSRSGAEANKMGDGAGWLPRTEKDALAIFAVPCIWQEGSGVELLDAYIKRRHRLAYIILTQVRSSRIARSNNSTPCRKHKIEVTVP